MTPGNNGQCCGAKLALRSKAGSPPPPPPATPPEIPRARGSCRCRQMHKRQRHRRRLARKGGAQPPFAVSIAKHDSSENGASVMFLELGDGGRAGWAAMGYVL